MDDRLIGLSLGQYRIVARVGQGGMGAVYKAYQPPLDRYVALKVLNSDVVGGPDFSARFRREARAVASLEHPNILPLYDFDEQNGIPFLVMPFMAAGTLRDRLRPSMPYDWSVRICGHLADALDHAHEHKVIHRDVKPANVLMGEGEWPFLSDFGISKVAGTSTEFTETGVGIGTPAYVSPEQGRGFEVDGRTDQYALAAMLFEMVAGRVPFEAPTPLAVVFKHVNEPVPSVRAINPYVPPALDEVLRQALAKQPEDRFPSCRAFAYAAAAAIESAFQVTRDVEYRPTVASPGGLLRGPVSEETLGPARSSAVEAVSVAEPGRLPIEVIPSRAVSVRKPDGQGVRRTVASAAMLAIKRRALALAGVAALLTVAAGVLLPRFWEPPPMAGLFNVAIAPFSEIDERGNARSWDQGAKVSEAIVLRLRDEFGSIPELKGMVEVRGHRVESVAGLTAAERQESARRIADRLHAQVLIYGTLEKSGSRAVFSPQFYISGLERAEELLGPNQLGAPVVLDGPSGLLSQVFLVSEASKARTEALSVFAIGLTYLAAGKGSAAVDYFERAIRVQGWDDRDGKEVLHLFLGAAYKTRGGESARDLARAAYEAAVRANPEYARAHLALGHIDFEEFAASGHSDTDALDRALVRYQQALAAQFRPESAYVDAKTHTALGNAYVVKAQMGQTELFAKARSEFQQVVDQYERGVEQLRSLSAYGYLGLGIIEERWTEDYARAAGYYRQALAVTDHDGLKRQAETQLRVVESSGR